MSDLSQVSDDDLIVELERRKQRQGAIIMKTESWVGPFRLNAGFYNLHYGGPAHPQSGGEATGF